MRIGVRSGKLDPALLEALLRHAPTNGAAVALGPGIGRDAAAVRLGESYLVLAADPITFDALPGRAGAAVVHVNANDVVCLGAAPSWFLATMLFPPGVAEAEVEAAFASLGAACASVGATLVGGHTEVSDAVTRPVVAGTMVGLAPNDRLYTPTAIRPGDALVQIGAAAIEGTALLASQAVEALGRAGVAAGEIAAAAALGEEPGISVVAMARAAWGAPGLRALHDPTEGGVATAAWEMAQAAGLGLEVEESALIAHPLTLLVAAAMGIDWRGLLASGCLLAGVAGADAEAFVGRMGAAGYPSAQVGHFNRTPEDDAEAAILRASEGPRALPRFTRDEALRVLRPKG
ncbi:MAG: Hydrogenase maturation factor [Chloroflexi bacterium]|nr:MAG: Hydrogenase maturation factor [Chloroflexota bacterium]